MAYLSKDDYMRRAESAARRHAENGRKIESSGISQEVSELLQELCSVRHNLHCNMDGLAVDSSNFTGNNPLKDLVRINSRLRELDFQTMDFVPAYDDDFIDIDDMALLADIEGMDSDCEGYQEWYNSNYERIISELSELNKKIEKYLGEIDVVFGTCFRPTGQHRIL